jgi:hypothetical protein
MKARGFAHSSKDSVKQVRVTIPVDTLPDELETIRADGDEWGRLFAADVPYIRVSYESFVTGRSAEINRLQSFLGVPVNAALESSLKKLNRSSLGEIVVNLDDVKRRLDGTPFEWCLRGRD